MGDSFSEFYPLLVDYVISAVLTSDYSKCNVEKIQLSGSLQRISLPACTTAAFLKSQGQSAGSGEKAPTTKVFNPTDCHWVSKDNTTGKYKFGDISKHELEGAVNLAAVRT